jgi:biofilm PGA synthesis lipoprotein PgaB
VWVLRRRLIRFVVLLLAAVLTSPAAAGPDSPEPRVEKSAELPPHAVVLMYHRFGEDSFPSTSIRVDQFEAQLKHLEEGGFEVLPLEQVLAAVSNGRSLPDLSVSITVDDAFRSVFDVAFPRLKARGWPFTIFVNSDSIDKKMPAYMTWDQMRSMRDHGVTFANHTASHDSLIERRAGESDESWKKRLRADIERCRTRLREELGETPALFA